MIGIPKCPECGEIVYNLSDFTYCDRCDVLRDGDRILLKTSLWSSKSAKHRFIYAVLLAKRGLMPLSDLLDLFEEPMTGDDAFYPAMASTMKEVFGLDWEERLKDKLRDSED